MTSEIGWAPNVIELGARPRPGTTRPRSGPTGAVLTTRRAEAPSRASRDIARCLQEAIEELTTELGDRYGYSRICAEAERAVQDLQGSISVEALPEMVSRLVHVRIAEPQR